MSTYLAHNGSKEAWLLGIGGRKEQSGRMPGKGEVSVCLLDRGAWVAASVAFDEHSLAELNQPDSDYDAHPRIWFRVPVEKLDGTAFRDDFDRDRVYRAAGLDPS